MTVTRVISEDPADFPKQTPVRDPLAPSLLYEQPPPPMTSVPLEVSRIFVETTWFNEAKREAGRFPIEALLPAT